MGFSNPLEAYERRGFVRGVSKVDDLLNAIAAFNPKQERQANGGRRDSDPREFSNDGTADNATSVKPTSYAGESSIY